MPKKKRKRPEFYSAEFIQLNHYFTRSIQELKEKIDRGWSFDASADKYQNKAMATSKYIEENLVEDRSMLDFIEETGIKLTT